MFTGLHLVLQSWRHRSIFRLLSMTCRGHAHGHPLEFVACHLLLPLHSFGGVLSCERSLPQCMRSLLGGQCHCAAVVVADMSTCTLHPRHTCQECVLRMTDPSHCVQWLYMVCFDNQTGQIYQSRAGSAVTWPGRAAQTGSHSVLISPNAVETRTTLGDCG
jgi:hypothetical protein